VIGDWGSGDLRFVIGDWGLVIRDFRVSIFEVGTLIHLLA